MNAPDAPSTIKFTMEQKPVGAATNWKTVAQVDIAGTEWIRLAGDYAYTEDMEALTFYAESSNKDDAFYLDDVVITMTEPPQSPSIEENLLALRTRCLSPSARRSSRISCSACRARCSRSISTAWWRRTS